MNSREILSAFAIATISAFTTTPVRGQPFYDLTTTIASPDPNRTNHISEVVLTDDYLVVGAGANSRPSSNGQILLFDATGENLLRTIDDPQTRGYQSVTFGDTIAADGNHIVTTDYLDSPGLVHIFDATTGSLRHTLQSPILGHIGFAGTSVAISGDNLIVGSYAISAGPFGPKYPARVFVFDAVTGALRHAIAPPEGVTVSSWGERIDIEGSLIAVGSPAGDDASVFLYDAISGEQAGIVPVPQSGGFESLRLSDGKLLLGNIRRNATLYNTAGELLNTFESPFNSTPGVNGAYFEFCGSNVLIGSFGSAEANTTIAPDAKLFDSILGTHIQTYADAGPGDRFFEVAASPSGDRFAIIRADIETLLSTDILVYSKVPEPSAALLAGLAFGSMGLNFFRKS